MIFFINKAFCCKNYFFPNLVGRKANKIYFELSLLMMPKKSGDGILEFNKLWQLVTRFKMTSSTGQRLVILHAGMADGSEAS